MTVTISFRVSEELEEFLEQEAKERMTTKSTVAQMMLAERVTQIRDDTDTNGTGKDAEEPASTGLLGEARRIEFQSKDAADAFRDEYSQFVDGERDDLRLSRVAVIEDTPVRHLPDSEV
jgi:predicted transcriptional regulator